MKPIHSSARYQKHQEADSLSDATPDLNDISSRNYHKSP